jgi:hypothetical protein
MRLPSRNILCTIAFITEKCEFILYFAVMMATNIESLIYWFVLTLYIKIKLSIYPPIEGTTTREELGCETFTVSSNSQEGLQISD